MDKSSISSNKQKSNQSSINKSLKKEQVSKQFLEENQVSQFNVQSTEQFTTRNDMQQEESKDETSLFDKQLYDRSLIENPSQDIVQLQSNNYQPDRDGRNNYILETQSENQDSAMEAQREDVDISEPGIGWQRASRMQNEQKANTIFNSTRSSGHERFHPMADPQQNSISQMPYILDQQSPYQDLQSTMKKQKTVTQRVPFPMKKTTIDRIIYPVYTKKGIKYGKKRATSVEQNHQLHQMQTESMGKLLDGFLILYSCRVKLPHEAIKSKLASQKIVEVIEEDLCYFQNLNSIELSDNRVRLEQLRNLKALSDVNLQYNNIQTIPPLTKDDFPKLETVNLSYNSITPASIRNLYAIQRLKLLDLQGNNLVTLPDDLKELKQLEELNLSSNLLSSTSTLINPSTLFKALGQMPKLKRLNLSRNKFSAFHGEFLSKNEDYQYLQELDFGFNIIYEEDDLWASTNLKNLQILVITGNPFAMNGKQYYQRLEDVLQKNLSAVVINEHVPDHRNYLRKPKTQKQLVNFPYPNPIKLFSREVQKEIKGDYLNAELMNQGVALQIAEIRPNTNIEQEIFPRELTRDAQEKDIFTPPNHRQMRFLNSQGAQADSKPSSSNEQHQFFLTENIEQIGDSKIIHEERSQESEVEEQNEEEEEEPEEEIEDVNFDFGKAKMDYFKQKAKEILTQDKELEYEGNALNLNMCFKNLKNALRNPVVVHTNGENKPNYLKMTFSMCRNAVNGDRFLEFSKLQSLTKGSKYSDSSSIANSKIDKVSSILGGSKQLPPLMRAGKEYANGDEDVRALMGTQKKKSKKEELIDRKIENLLETYKKQDEQLMRRAQEKELNKNHNKKILRDKFGFSDEEENDDDDEEQALSVPYAGSNKEVHKKVSSKFSNSQN